MLPCRKRTVGQFTTFDLLVVLLLSEAVSAGLVGGDHSVSGALVAVATARSVRLQALVEGAPVLSGRDGRLYADTLKRNHVPQMDVERALREADCDLKDLKYAFLEADGGISVLKASSGEVRQEKNGA